MNELTTELIGLLRQADKFKGIHQEVYDLKIFSDQYLRMIKDGKVVPKDKPRNWVKMRDLIYEYETRLHKVKQELKEVA